MKNDIAAYEENGKFGAVLYAYHEKPSGFIVPHQAITGKAIFETVDEARKHLYENLKPEIQENTNWKENET